MPASPLPTLQTPRLTLRPLTAADADAVYHMIDASRELILSLVSLVPV